MTEFNSVQLKTIDQYRAKHNISPVVSNEAVAEQILAEMKASGVSYAGFESLISEVGTKSVILERDSSSLFEYGFTSDYTDGFVKSESKPAPTYTNAQYNEAMDFAKQYLMDSSASVHNALINYSNSVGRVSFGSVWHIMKNIADLFTDRAFRTNNIKTHAEAMEEARKAEFEAKRLSGFSAGLPFETEYKKSRGIEFDVAKVENFKTKSEEYMFVKACKNQYDLLDKGIKEVQGLYVREKQLERFGQNNVSTEEVKSFDERLIEILDQYCGGDENLRNQLILEISGDIKSKDELDKRFLEVLTKLRDNAKTVLDSQLNGKDFDEYHEEYTKAYAETFGGEDAQEAVNGWIAKQEAGTQFLKMSAIIAATILTGGSALAANSTASLASALGSKFAAQQIVKLAITLEGVGVGVGAEYLNALTSKTGLTEERNEQILQGAKHSLPYALFGAFVSGPLGDKVTNALIGNASPALSGIVKTAFEKSTTGVGFATEVGLDVLFESALGDGEFAEIIKGNVNGELQGRALNKLMTMIMGGRAHYASKTAIEGAENSVTQALKNMGLEGYKAKMNDDGSFQIKSPDGETYNASVDDFAKIFATLADNAVKIEEQKIEEANIDNDMPFENVRIDTGEDSINETTLVLTKTDDVEVEKEKPVHTMKSLVEPGSLKTYEAKGIKPISELVPRVKPEELALPANKLVTEVLDVTTGKTKKALTPEADMLVFRAAEDLRANAIDNEEGIVSSFKKTGLVVDENNFEYRAKSLQSFHDKLMTYLFDNPGKTLEDAIRDVRDSVAMRTVHKSEDITNHPEVVELIEKGDVKSAVTRAVQIESEFVFNSLINIIDKMANGAAEFSISRISNYMGEDGIPYFTEEQLNSLKEYAYSKGINIPIRPLQGLENQATQLYKSIL